MKREAVMMKPFALIALILLAGCANMPPPPQIAGPLIIAHRGASAERPEHTLEAYQRAIDQGADYIEPDLVMTRDGVLIARHENEISGTTDISDHPEFADRRTTRTIDGVETTGWFTEDFTLAEIKTLRARERLPDLRPGNTEYDDRSTIPTLAEILSLVYYVGHPLGIAPELKHPGYFRARGLPMERVLVEQLAEAGYDSPEDSVFIQSFEIASLRRLDRLTDLRLLQLIGGEGGPADASGITYAQMLTPEGLTAMARYADAIGPDKAQLIALGADGEPGDATGLVERAHAAGLAVIPYTFRPENYFLPPSMRIGSDPRAQGEAGFEIARYLALGIDGLFTDYVPPALATRARPAPTDTITVP